MQNVVPFVANSPDDLHCLQAAYLMIVQFFKPEFEMDWDEWSQLTGFEQDKGTWASAGLVWMHANGFFVKHVSLFNYNDFISTGADYLMKEFGQEVATWQVKHSNIPLEQDRAKILVNNNLVEFHEPTQDDIKQYLRDGYLVECLVNMGQLNGKGSYIGHAVVVSGFDDSGFTIQDPGAPALQNRQISYEDFEKAWADPNKEAKELSAIKLLTLSH
jgi:hypothetical protein